jgi:hypothetical protein
MGLIGGWGEIRGREEFEDEKERGDTPLKCLQKDLRKNTWTKI